MAREVKTSGRTVYLPIRDDEDEPQTPMEAIAAMVGQPGAGPDVVVTAVEMLCAERDRLASLSVQLQASAEELLEQVAQEVPP